MITFAPLTETHRTEPMRLDWLPLIALTTTALLLSTQMPPWAGMWLIAIALFFGFKWWTWRRAVVAVDLRATGSAIDATAAADAKANQPRAQRSRATLSLAYLLLWPGMSAHKFLTSDASRPVVRATCCPDARSAQEATPKPHAWTWALTKALLGATLLWAIARLAGHGLLAGWIGMVGFIFLLHFGLFALLSLFWQSRGIDAPPLMKCPIAAQSLHDFWGRRWNAGFHDIVSGLFFLPMARRFGATAAAILTFVISGFLHELVITIPAGGGYGLPILYFTLQGVAMMLERKRVPIARTTCCPGARSAQEVAGSVRTSWASFRHARLGSLPGRIFTMAVVTLPIFALFPPVFVLRVMIPFFQLIHAL